MKKGFKIKLLSIGVALTGLLATANSATASPLTYHGGPVVRNPQVRVIFWGSNWNQNPGAREQIQGLFSSLSGTAYQGILTQYNDTGGYISPNVGFDFWTDQSIVAPNNVNWTNIENEIQYAIGQRGWPGGGINNVYIVLPAPGAKYEAGFTLGCGSHYVASSLGSPMAYVGWPGDEPYKGCASYDPGKQDRAWAAASVTASHEYAEAVTDPVTKKYLGTFNGVGWITEENEDEIADKCISVGGGTANGYYVNYLWDNSQNQCTLSHPISPPATPPTVQTTPATAIQEGQATLNGTVNPNGYETTYRFEYGKTTAYGKSIPIPNAGAGAGTSAVPVYLTPNNLQPRTRYHYRLVASSPGGTAFGSDQAFTTGVRWYLRNSNSAGSTDAAFWFGLPGEKKVTGDWNKDGTTTAGNYDPVTGVWKLRNSNTTGKADVEFQFGGGPWSTPVTGDWDGDGTTTIGVYDPATGKWRLKNSNSAGNADVEVQYGGSQYTPVPGDWNGNGTTTIGVFEPSGGNWYLRNANTPGPAEISVQYGGSQFRPVVGDWDNNKTTTIGLFEPNSGSWQLRNANSPGAPQIVFSYGGSQFVPLTGDWDNNGTDTPILAEPNAETVNEWHLRNTNSAGNPDLDFEFSTYGLKEVTGDWNGDGVDTPGVYNSVTGNWYLRNSNTTGFNELVEFQYGGGPWTEPVAGDWNNDGKDTIGVYDPVAGNWNLRNSNSAGSPDYAFQYGGGPWAKPVAGDWNANGTDTIGVYDPVAGNWNLRDSNSAGSPNYSFQYGGSIWTEPIAGDWDGNKSATIGVYDLASGVWHLRNSNSAGNPDLDFQYGGGEVWGALAGDWNKDGKDTVGVGTR